MKATAKVQSISDGVAYVTVQAGTIRFGFSADVASIATQAALDEVVLDKLKEQVPAPQAETEPGEVQLDLAEGRSIDVDVPDDLAAMVPV